MMADYVQMALAKFSIIVAIDSGNGISKNGDIPWSSKDDVKFFKDTTTGKGRNAVIMGRLTYESIPLEFRPLPGRTCVIISRTMRQENHRDIKVYPSLLEALIGLGGSINAYDDIFIAGGEQIYAEAIRNFMYLCKRIHVTKFKSDYKCDLFFPFESVKDLPQGLDPTKTRDYTRYMFTPSVQHNEYQYLDLLRDVKNNGENRMERTGTGTVSKFGSRMEFDIRDTIPIITTKRISYDIIIRELLFFISGETNTKELERNKVNIWKKNTSRETLDKLGLNMLEEGDMGPGYGFQWRHWGADYKGFREDYRGKGIDQLQEVIRSIRNDPLSRRHILTSWNVSQIKEMALPPCHAFAQFYVSGDKKWLDCQLYQRSGDMFLGVPFNIASYAILTYMIAHVTNLKPRRLVHILGDAHIYNNHGEQVKRQLGRVPHPFPTLSFRDPTRIHEIDDFVFDSFIVNEYTSWPAISADMAV